MPVEPIPCADGGGTTPIEVTTCCSPSIASTPLCREDGSTVLLVVRSGCIECGEAPGDPEAVGWIDTATGAFTAGAPPADVGPCSGASCCSPSITSASLCREDGTPVLAVIRSACVECGDDAPDPLIVGWFDLTAGTFTPGALPVDAGPCDAGCLDTVCRQLCDDTDGDGAADATYSELWCIRADGTADLVLTYQDDPSVPYEPVSPVECTYGCPETETVQLCDDAGPFLRRYTWLEGTATFEDVDLDGRTPHLVTGDVRTCTGGSASDCEAATTPAATLGLCLADGTPIAVLVTRDCDGTVAQDGWLNLTTGVYAAGGPPVGTMACGNPRSITTAGTFCDVDPDTGAVLGLVLIEYTYGADGSVDAVRLVDATTGSTYTPQGEVTTCPAGVEQPGRDLAQLCDTAPDGTVTPFVRDYARDESGAITGHADYDLDGAAYTVTGTVDRCADDCQSCETVVLCDLPASASTAPVLDPASTGNAGNRTGTAANGVGWSTIGGRAGSDPANWWSVSLFPAPSGTFTLTLTRPVAVTWGVRLGAAPVVGTLASLTMPVGSVPTYVHPLHSWDPATRTLTAMPGSSATNTAHTSTFAHAGPITVVQFTGTASGPLGTVRKVGDFRITPVEQPFLRRTCRDCDGQTVTTTDTRLDGVTPYVPAGTVGVCSGAPDEQCVPLALGEVCYSPALTSAALSLGTAVDGTWTQATSGTVPVSDPSTLTYAAAPVGPPVSTAGVGPVTGQVRPGLGTALGDTALGFSYLRRQFTTTSAITAVALAATADDRPHRIWLDGTVVADFSVTPGSPSLTDPNAYNQSWSPVVTAAVSLPAGAHTLYYEWASHGGVTREWGALDVRLTLSERAPSARAQSVQHCDGTKTLIDIETGLTVPATSTIVACPDGSSTAGCCADAEVVQLCDTATDGTVSAFLRHVTYEDGAPAWATDTELDGVTPYTAAGTVGVCSSSASEPCRDSTTVLLCDLDPDCQAGSTLTADDEPDPSLFDNWAGSNYCLVSTGGQGAPVWAGGSAVIGPDTECPVGGHDTHRAVAVRLTGGSPSATGTVKVTVSVRATNAGPNPGWGGDGRFGLWDTTTGATRLTYVAVPSGAAVGVSHTMSLTYDVPAASLAAGNIVAALDVETYHNNGPKAWTIDGFMWSAEVPATECEQQILRTIVRDCETGETVSVTDTTLDGTPYTVTGEVGQCSTATPPVPEVPPCEAQSVIEACRCDDTDGDGLPDVGYVELLAVDCAGVLTSIGTYTSGLTEPYAPVSPVDCDALDDEEGADPAFGVQARRVELTAGASWSASAWPTLQSVTAVAHGGTGTVTTTDGTSTLHTGEAATWSVGRDADAALTGPLTITADTGTVTLSYTIGVTL